VASVCVKPYAVPLAAQVLHGSDVAVGTVVGFPHGSHEKETKAFEADLACRHGARELDMVVNIGKVLQQDWDYVRADIQAVADVAKKYGAVLKVIFETDYVTDDQLKIQLCQICKEIGVDYVKTSTGFGFVRQPDGRYGYQGATAHDVQLMRANCAPHVQVKAAGGIRSYADACRLRDIGAARLGTSATEAIVSGQADV
jgi:deoxyribose-phosphate aldolase